MRWSAVAVIFLMGVLVWVIDLSSAAKLDILSSERLPTDSEQQAFAIARGIVRGALRDWEKTLSVEDAQKKLHFDLVRALLFSQWRRAYCKQEGFLYFIALALVYEWPALLAQDNDESLLERVYCINKGLVALSLKQQQHLYNLLEKIPHLLRPLRAHPIDWGTVIELLKDGVPANSWLYTRHGEDPHTATLLAVALEESAPARVIDSLIEHGANGNLGRIGQYTPLGLALAHRHMHAIRRLVGMGIDLTACVAPPHQAEPGVVSATLAWHVALASGVGREVLLLLGGIPEGHEGEALYWALEHGTHEMLPDVLLRPPPQSPMRNRIIAYCAHFDKQQLLTLAVAKKANDVVRLLLELGVDPLDFLSEHEHTLVHDHGYDGDNPFMMAAAGDNIAMLTEMRRYLEQKIPEEVTRQRWYEMAAKVAFAQAFCLGSTGAKAITYLLENKLVAGVYILALKAQYANSLYRRRDVLSLAAHHNATILVKLLLESGELVPSVEGTEHEHWHDEERQRHPYLIAAAYNNREMLLLMEENIRHLTSQEQQVAHDTAARVAALVAFYGHRVAHTQSPIYTETPDILGYLLRNNLLSRRIVKELRIKAKQAAACRISATANAIRPYFGGCSCTLL